MISKKPKHLNYYSLKRIEKINAEVPIRLKLIERCGGKPAHVNRTVYNNGKPYTLKRVYCIGGRCEICKLPAGYEVLEPHEQIRRSAGGKLSLMNSVMCHRECHRNQHSKPQLKWLP